MNDRELSTDPAGLPLLAALLIVVAFAGIIATALFILGVAGMWWPLGFACGLVGVFAVSILTVAIHDARTGRLYEGVGGRAED